MTQTERNLLSIGAAFHGPSLDRAIKKLQWEPPAGPKPFSPGMGISELIKVLKIPKVSAIAIGYIPTPKALIKKGYTRDGLGLYGIEGHYSNAPTVRIYAVDEGTHLTPVATDVTR